MVKGIKVSGDLIQTSLRNPKRKLISRADDSAELYKQITSGPYGMS